MELQRAAGQIEFNPLDEIVHLLDGAREVFRGARNFRRKRRCFNLIEQFLSGLVQNAAAPQTAD